MATLKDYFISDFKNTLSENHNWKVKNDHEDLDILLRIHADFDSNATFISIFIPSNQNPSELLKALLSKVKNLDGSFQAIEVSSGRKGESPSTSKTLVYTKQVFIYLEDQLRSEDTQLQCKLWSSHGLTLTIRSNEYVENLNQWQSPIAFLSHDSRDKDEIANPIARGFIKNAFPIWYDEYSLKPGDSLRESIENGLKKCKKCIVIISPNFISNTGWTKTEFNSVFTREIFKNENVFIPIWHNVTKEQVYEYSPSLADKFALDSSIGADQLVHKLIATLK